jgi:hypothetical protein
MRRLAQGVVRIGLGTLPIAAVPAAPSGPIQSYDTYKSWFVACDNTLHCVARGFGETDEAKAEIARDAGPARSIQ